MKSLQLYLTEDQSHIDDFIQFLLDNSEEGELKSNKKSYYDYYDECDPFDNPKFSLNIDNTVYGEDYCEEHEIDSVEDDKDNFIEYIKNIVDEQLTLELERGLIKIERVISLDSSFRASNSFFSSSLSKDTSSDETLMNFLLSYSIKA